VLSGMVGALGVFFSYGMGVLWLFGRVFIERVCV